MNHFAQYFQDPHNQTNPKLQWWKSFLKNSGGTGFWHETYLMKGGMEAIYDDLTKPIGFLQFAPAVQARGPMFGATARAGQGKAGESVLSESELYD